MKLKQQIFQKLKKRPKKPETKASKASVTQLHFTFVYSYWKQSLFSRDILKHQKLGGPKNHPQHNHQKPKWYHFIIFVFSLSILRPNLFSGSLPISPPILRPFKDLFPFNGSSPVLPPRKGPAALVAPLSLTQRLEPQKRFFWKYISKYHTIYIII